MVSSFKFLMAVIASVAAQRVGLSSQPQQEQQQQQEIFELAKKGFAQQPEVEVDEQFEMVLYAKNATTDAERIQHMRHMTPENRKQVVAFWNAKDPKSAWKQWERTQKGHDFSHVDDNGVVGQRICGGKEFFTNKWTNEIRCEAPAGWQSQQEDQPRKKQKREKQQNSQQELTEELKKEGWKSAWTTLKDGTKKQYYYKSKWYESWTSATGGSTFDNTPKEKDWKKAKHKGRTYFYKSQWEYPGTEPLKEGDHVKLLRSFGDYQVAFSEGEEGVLNFHASSLGESADPDFKKQDLWSVHFETGDLWARPQDLQKVTRTSRWSD